MRSFLLLACILGTQILLTDAQGRTGRPGVGDTRRVQAALREFGIGDNLPGSPGKAFNLSEFLRILGENPSGSPLSSPGPVTTTTTRPTGRPGTTSTAGSTTVTRTSTSAPATDQGVSAQTLAAIELEFADLFRNSPEKIAKHVQMGFHICVGGCDGCLDLEDSDNKGLIPHYQELRSMYSRWSTQLSLADYAVISAFQSVKAGVERNTDGCDGPCSIDFTFVPGRRTCDNPDSPPRRPLPQGVDIHAPQGIAAEFGLTPEEMVALMGAHSLGSLHANVSGFSGPWDLTPTTLDNGYYLALTRVRWTQEFQPAASATQWVGTTRSGPQLTMLHTDMILQHNFTVVEPRNNASCASSRRCPLSDTATHVENFASDNDAFLVVFQRAITKMCNNGL